MDKRPLYYGEIVARISGQLFNITDLQVPQISLRDTTMEEMICSVSADAARVFDTFEDLSGEHYIDWHKALENYAISLRKFIYTGSVPTMGDLITIAAASLDTTRTEQLSSAVH